jgi:hypothetical protein
MVASASRDRHRRARILAAGSDENEAVLRLRPRAENVAETWSGERAARREARTLASRSLRRGRYLPAAMDIGDLPELASGFVSLLLLPALGVVGLMHRRAVQVLGWTLVAWFAVGAIALWTHYTWRWNENRFMHLWVLGLGLGSAFLIIAMLYRDRRVSPWIRSGLALMTVIVFLRSLLQFLRHHA